MGGSGLLLLLPNKSVVFRGATVDSVILTHPHTPRGAWPAPFHR